MSNPQRPNSTTDRSQIHLWLPTPLYEALRELASDNGASMTRIITEALEIGVRSSIGDQAVLGRVNRVQSLLD